MDALSIFFTDETFRKPLHESRTIIVSISPVASEEDSKLGWQIACQL